MIVFVSAGEASGDAYGAAFVSEMRRLALEVGHADLTVLALGGRRLGPLTDRLVADSSSWGVVSIVQSLKVVPRILVSVRKLPGIMRKLGRDNALAVPIDFGFMNVRFARLAKKNGWKVLAFVPPGSWRRDRQAQCAPELYDAVSTPFEWSAEILSRMGTPDVHCFGHPLKQLLRERISATGTEERTNQIAVLPGSRKHEVAANLPVIAASLPDISAEFGLAAGTDEAGFLRRWKALAPGRNDRISVGDAAGVLLRSRAAIVCSGTATLEAALCRCPMAVIYSGSRGMMLEAKLLHIKRPKFVALPNILLDRMLVEEFIAYDAVPEKIGPYLRELLSDGPVRQAQLAGFEELDQALGPDDAITQTARLALRMLGVSR